MIDEERQSIRDDMNYKMWLYGNREYFDECTFVPDPRTTDEILSRVPKCCIGMPPAPTMAELAKKYPLKPADKKDTSRAKQKHQEQI